MSEILDVQSIRYSVAKLPDVPIKFPRKKVCDGLRHVPRNFHYSMNDK